MLAKSRLNLSERSIHVHHSKIAMSIAGQIHLAMTCLAKCKAYVPFDISFMQWLKDITLHPKFNRSVFIALFLQVQGSCTVPPDLFFILVETVYLLVTAFMDDILITFSAKSLYKNTY